MKRIVAIIAALALLCSSALASGLFDPETVVSTYNDRIVPILTEHTGSSSKAQTIADQIKVEYSSSSSDTGSVYYWNDDFSFSINFSAKDRYSTAEYTSVWMGFDKNSSVDAGYPLLMFSLVAGWLDPDLDAYSFYQWLFAMEDESRFESKNWDAYMSIADDGSYMGFSIFPN